MDREVQVVLLAGGFGVLGTIIGSIVQYMTSERSARIRRVEETNLRSRNEKREGYANVLAAFRAVIGEIHQFDVETTGYGRERMLRDLSVEVFEDLRVRLTGASGQLTRSHVEVQIIATREEVRTALSDVEEHVRKITNLWNKDREVGEIVDWATQLGGKYGNLVLAFRKDLGIE